MRSKTALLVLLQLLVAQELAAQTCQPTLTVLQCFTEIRRAAMDNQGKSRTEQKPTGDAQATGTGTSIQDFLPKAAGAAILPGISNDFGGLSLARNFTLDTEYTWYLPVAVQVAGMLRKPTVLKSIIDTLPKSSRLAVKQRFEDSLDEFDDPELSLSVTLETRKWGRRWEKHRAELSNIGAPAQANDLLDALDQLQKAVATTTTACARDNNFINPLSCFSESDQAVIIGSLQKVVSAESEFASALQNWQKESGWNLLPDMINNKPQLTVRAVWNPRDAVVGPEALRVIARWEGGFANINATRRYCKRNNGYVAGKFTADCFKQHAAGQVNKTMLKLGLRFFVELDGTFDRPYNAPYAPEDAAVYSTPSASSYTISGGIGGNLPSSGEIQSARFDLAFGHVSAAKDGARTDDRTWLSLTHTQMLADKTSLLSGLEWSDKAEFKHEPTAKLRANFGVRYKLITPEKKSR